MWSEFKFNFKDIHIDHFQIEMIAGLSSAQVLSLTLCDPMNHSMPGLPVHHQLPEFTQTYVHRVADAI